MEEVIIIMEEVLVGAEEGIKVADIEEEKNNIIDWFCEKTEPWYK